jgi:hypothetical protein
MWPVAPNIWCCGRKTIIKTKPNVTRSPGTVNDDLANNCLRSSRKRVITAVMVTVLILYWNSLFLLCAMKFTDNTVLFLVTTYCITAMNFTDNTFCPCYHWLHYCDEFYRQYIFFLVTTDCITAMNFTDNTCFSLLPLIALLRWILQTIHFFIVTTDCITAMNFTDNTFFHCYHYIKLLFLMKHLVYRTCFFALIRDVHTRKRLQNEAQNRVA